MERTRFKPEPDYLVLTDQVAGASQELKDNGSNSVATKSAQRRLTIETKRSRKRLIDHAEMWAYAGRIFRPKSQHKIAGKSSPGRSTHRRRPRARTHSCPGARRRTASSSDPPDAGSDPDPPGLGTSSPASPLSGGPQSAAQIRVVA